MIRILLIRHARAEQMGRVLYGRMPGIHLDSDGLIEARKLAEVINLRYRLAGIVSSPMERAQETAQFIAGVQGVEISIDHGLNEIDFGGWQGKAFEELAHSDDWKQYNRARSAYCPPRGEFMTQVQTRAWNSVQQIISHHQSDDMRTVALVTHGDVIRALLILLLGMALDHIHRLEIDPASVSEVLLGAGQPRVRTINELFSAQAVAE